MVVSVVADGVAGLGDLLQPGNAFLLEDTADGTVWRRLRPDDES